jgi:uncharacterized protein YbaP (TraB family)
VRRSCARALACALTVFGCAHAVAAEPSSAPFSRGLLFRVDAPGRAPSWVFGTLHSNDPRVVDVAPVVSKALAGARRLAAEMLLTPAAAPAFFEAAQFEDRRRLADYLDAATLARVKQVLGPALPEDGVFDRLKPWAVLMLLAQAEGGRSGPTLDEVLVDEAQRRRIAVIGLELPDEQVAALDTIPLQSQVALVRWTLDRQHRLAADHENTIAAWLDRDLGQLAALARAPGRVDPAVAPHFRALTTHVVENRSVLMAHRLFLPLREGRVFVAVGALHLYGPCGLLALIRAQGYRIQRVYRVKRARHRLVRASR